MPTIQIPVSEVRKGDVIDVAGVKFTVEYDFDPKYPHIVFTEGDGGPIGFPAGATITVDRPDPDAELIEAMIDAYAHSGGRDGLRAMLAVVREWDARADQ